MLTLMKSLMRPILVVCLLSFTFTSCTSENDETIPPANDVHAIASRIETQLPGNWSIEKTGDQIILSRNAPVRTHVCVNLDLGWVRHPELLAEFVEKYGVTRPYKIRLRFGRRLDLAEYQRANESNEQIKVTRDTVIPDREFFEVDAMRSFDPNYRELPVYFTEDTSVYVETTLHPWECIYPPADARGCESVRVIVDSLFVRYPEARIDTSFSWMAL